MILDVVVTMQVRYGPERLALVIAAESVTPVRFDADEITPNDLDSTDLLQAALDRLFTEVREKSGAKVTELRFMLAGMNQEDLTEMGLTDPPADDPPC